jgi:hypothetical protein
MMLNLTRDDDDEDETAALMRELERIKKERAEAKAKEVFLTSYHQLVQSI